jgi:hypothetical protein
MIDEPDKRVVEPLAAGLQSGYTARRAQIRARKGTLKLTALERAGW